MDLCAQTVTRSPGHSSHPPWCFRPGWWLSPQRFLSSIICHKNIILRPDTFSYRFIYYSLYPQNLYTITLHKMDKDTNCPSVRDKRPIEALKNIQFYLTPITATRIQVCGVQLHLDLFPQSLFLFHFPTCSLPNSPLSNHVLA